jgi:hypothetical protein
MYTVRKWSPPYGYDSPTEYSLNQLNFPATIHGFQINKGGRIMDIKLRILLFSVFSVLNANSENTPKVF